MPDQPRDTAAFRELAAATRDDWKIIERAERDYRRDHGPARGLLAMLASTRDDPALGVPINLYAHCLQTATRVLEAGLDDELAVVALFHDLPEAFSENHHGLLAAQMLAPWLSPRRAWVLTHHVEFQAVHFANHPTRDRNERERWRGHPYFDETAEFCALYDQNSFDPAYKNLPLEAFEPIVRRFFAGPAPAPVTLAD
jgi:predicted HD phosphohydrolase